MWDFEYKIECYVPKEKRVHGYYVLPVLDHDCLVGRLDAKANRKDERLDVISLYLEHRDSRKDPALGRLAKGLKSLAKFNRCSEIGIGTVYPNFVTKYSSSTPSIIIFMYMVALCLASTLCSIANLLHVIQYRGVAGMGVYKILLPR
jgi:hypothetical protein